MVVLRANEIERFIAEPPARINGVLIYGPNEGRVSDISSSIVKSVLGSLDDPFNLVHLSDTQLKEAPGILRDEMLALSFTGGRKVIWIKNPGVVLNKQLLEFFKSPKSENLLVIQTGQLKKPASLRKQFEAAKSAICIPCYEDSRQDLKLLISEHAKSAGKSINADTIEILLNSVGADRALIAREMEKLVLFLGERKEISINDIELLCADPLEGSLDDICDAALIGDIVKCTRQFHHLISSGIQAAQILNTVLSHLMRLQKYRIDIEKGQSITNVIKGSRPPIFFKRQGAINRQLQIWYSSSLSNALKNTFKAISQTRENPALADSICERTLIALSKRAQSYSH